VLLISVIKTESFCDGIFHTCGPRLWNLLPSELRGESRCLPALPKSHFVLHCVVVVIASAYVFVLHF